MTLQENIHNISVTWRGKIFVVEMTSDATLKELGHKLQILSNVKEDTMRLIVPQTSKTSKLLYPFSEEHSSLSLAETSFFEAKSIKMMGAPQDEVDEVLKSAKTNLRIAGFEEEEKRMKQRMSDRPQTSLRLPQGPYIFFEFRTLQIPGVELNPPASEALKRMHMLAADPGIVAIMNKHRWRVGLMTEMAPEGYVGVSPKCVLGFNKNHGEEISLRLRTDDLKGFRKYESIKKTLLHELAHMVHSEHDKNFYALNKQLNQEAATLDWTRSKGHTLSGIRHSEQYKDFLVDNHASFSQKLGGTTSDQLSNARATSVAAAHRRLANAHSDLLRPSNVHEEPDPDDIEFGIHRQPDPVDVVGKGQVNVENPDKTLRFGNSECEPNDFPGNQNKFEPDPDDPEGVEAMESDAWSHFNEGIIISEPDPDDSFIAHVLPPLAMDRNLTRTVTFEEPDPDDSGASLTLKVESDCNTVPDSLDNIQQMNRVDEPDPDDSKSDLDSLRCGNIAGPDQIDIFAIKSMENKSQLSTADKEPDPEDSQMTGIMQAEPDPDDNLVGQERISRAQTHEHDLDDQELQRIQDPVAVICTRLQKAIEMLQSEVNPSEVAGVFQTLFKIIRNLIEHPSEMKFKRIRKANPIIQRNVVKYKAAMEFLFLIGFNEDLVLDEIGKADNYLVLRRNDPGLLWLAKSSLETCIA